MSMGVPFLSLSIQDDEGTLKKTSLSEMEAKGKPKAAEHLCCTGSRPMLSKVSHFSFATGNSARQ